jgi:hypothetical protein
MFGKFRQILFPYFHFSQKQSTLNHLNCFYFLYYINNFLLLFKWKKIYYNTILFYFFHFSIQFHSTLYHINNFLLLLKKKKKKSIQRSLPNTTLDSLVTNTLFNLIIRLPKQPKYIYIYRTLRCFQTIKVAYMNPCSRNKRDWHVHWNIHRETLNMDYSTTDLINNVCNCTWSQLPIAILQLRIPKELHF